MPARPTPRNRAGQSPTRSPGETADRLEQKAARQKGAANRRRTKRKKTS